MIAIEDLKSELLSMSIETGEITLVDWEYWLAADAVLSPPLPNGIAHPIFAYYSALVGMRITLDELFAAAHSSADAGVMFGESGLEFRLPLKVGDTYTVEARFTDAERKVSNRLGTMDLVSFETRLIAADGAVATVATNTFIFPRGSES